MVISYNSIYKDRLNPTPTLYREQNVTTTRGKKKSPHKSVSEEGLLSYPKDHWTLKTGYFEDPTPAIQVQTLPLEGPRFLGYFILPVLMILYQHHPVGGAN